MTALSSLDYWIIGTFLAIILVVGLAASRLAARSMEHYFLGGRNLPWYLLGISGMSAWFDLTGTMIITSFLYLLGPGGSLYQFWGGCGPGPPLSARLQGKVPPPFRLHDGRGMEHLPFRRQLFGRDGAPRERLGRHHHDDWPAGLSGARRNAFHGHRFPRRSGLVDARRSRPRFHLHSHGWFLRRGAFRCGAGRHHDHRLHHCQHPGLATRPQR